MCQFHSFQKENYAKTAPPQLHQPSGKRMQERRLSSRRPRKALPMCLARGAMTGDWEVQFRNPWGTVFFPICLYSNHAASENI